MIQNFDILLILLAIIFTTIIISFIWRWLSTHYSLPCPSWLAWMIELDNPFAKAHHANSIIHASKLAPDMQVLDAGCGPGRLTIPMAKKLDKTGKVTALDIQQAMLDKVRTKAEKESLCNITYLHAALGEGKIPLKTFDRIYLITVIGEIPDKKKALNEIYHALKPDGILVITETIFDPHYQAFKKLAALTDAAGFQLDLKVGNILAYTANFRKKN